MKSHPKTKSASHQHHSHQGERPHPLSQFFGCCLGDDPAPISPKIQSLRENLGSFHTEQTTIQAGQYLKISKDMVVADLLNSFPTIKPFLQDLHPLGLLSPMLDQISLEIFFADQPVDLEMICLQLENIVNQNNNG